MYELQAKAASGAELSSVENCAWSCSKGQRPGHWCPGLGGLTTVLDVKIKMYPPTRPANPWP